MAGMNAPRFLFAFALVALIPLRPVRAAAAAEDAAPAAASEAASPAAATEAGPARAAPRWGPPTAGLAAAVQPAGAVRVRGPMRFHLLVRSAAGGPVALPPAPDAFAWMTVVQTFGEARESHYTAKVPMPAKDWPAKVAGETVLRLGPFDLGPRKAYGREAGRTLLTAYLTGETDLPKDEGALNRVLKAGKAVVRFTLCLSRQGQKPTLVRTEPTAVTVAPPEMASLEAGEREAFLKDLMAQFNRNPWAGLQAHDTCVRLGKAVVPRVAEAAQEAGRPAHARLWLATTLADIRDPRSVAALVRLLDDPSAGVRHVVAYHGPKQRSERLDGAILRKVTAGEAPQLAAWALLGFMVHRKTVPEAAVAAGLESRDPKARATAAEVLARHASDENLSALVALLGDAHERVRAVAAKMLGQSQRAEPRVLGALVKALDRPGETARQRICRALSDLAGKDMPYDPSADAKSRSATLAAWKAWWAERRPK